MSSGQLPSQEFPDVTDVYDRFAALTAMSPELGGSLLVYVGLDRSGIALAIAANIAGAASLGVEPELARAKAAIRSGACDFLVNTLDEALRILKNEIRRKKAVSVVLAGVPRRWWRRWWSAGCSRRSWWVTLPGWLRWRRGERAGRSGRRVKGRRLRGG